MIALGEAVLDLHMALNDVSCIEPAENMPKAFAAASETFDGIMSGHDDSVVYYVTLAHLAAHYALSMLGYVKFSNDIKELTGDEPTDKAIEDYVNDTMEMLAKPAFELCGQTMQAFSDRAAAINRAVEDLLGDVASHAIKSGLSYDVGDIMSGRGFSDFDKFSTDEAKTLLAVNLAYDALSLVPTPKQGGDAL